MNAIPDFLVSAAEQQVLDDLLAPLSPDAPCGPAARYDPVFTEIRLLREEDDPSLPMGQWERPLKRADWARIESGCTSMLTTRSKDLQIAAWLVESWVRQRGFVGLFLGLRLLDSLLRRYWPPLHPVIEDDGDCAARLAPLEWLNESLSNSVRVYAALLALDGGGPAHVTLADWERMTAQDLAADDTAQRKAPGGADAALTRAEIVAAAQQTRSALAATAAAVSHSLACLDAVIAFLAGQLGEASPNLAKLRNTLEAVQRVLVQLQPEAPEAPEEAINHHLATDGACAGDGGAPAPSTGQGDAIAPAPEAAGAMATWRSRGEAYATLEAVADYLAQIEPHSPTPFLIRRAVNWGRMALPELIAEIISEEGDLNRLVNVLGIKP